MIKLERTERPQCIRDHGLEWIKDYLDAKRAGDKDAIKLAEAKYRQKEIQKALKKMHFGKCAFCESYISHVSYPHIEHFKPKKIFPEKLVQWSNLLWACGVCNGASYKGDNFPTAAEDGPLVNPTLEDPRDFLTFTFDETTNLAVVGYKNLRGKTTKDTLGLNRPDLSTVRSVVVKKLVFLKAMSVAHDVPAYRRLEAKRLLDEAASSKEHYSAFAITLCR
ncbi:TIGR02646 family protein [Pseudomonas granadensis]|uniref:retron system putative HNH endonuclease n=1 Tax=Pseudomonas granadensis TaxID=1421430 RepID=UPI0019D0B2A6|nr:retron system putative HNH endonuclease [Pseudomonas granadensis]MBN6774218.1 TIGR02646 family protein [Pseudomonas granadensis]MBN6805308.1 TIGR02646 family protein [Pseudomonas granadensis]MBN6832244.1 TIGR02646 family protein [Pseudomonas granadensis]MBN6839502.1 TIGR02646 family protein [Pseudomonas granadensis]MBN6868667.1 TIGR02646 family protein [Pseudomonas granadensis]